MGKRDDKDNKTALDLINLIKDLVTDELNKRDNTCVCQVVACNEDGTYNIFVVPDTRTVITNVKSMSLEVIKVGDYVYVYKFQNKLNNAIILARAGTNAADIRFVTVENFNSTITSRSSGGGGKVDDVLVNNTSVVGEDKVARIDLTSYVLESELADVALSGDYDDLANKPYIPTKTSDLTNDSGYITSSALTNYVTTDTTQTITANKTFTGTTYFGSSGGISISNTGISIYSPAALNLYGASINLSSSSIIMGSASSFKTRSSDSYGLVIPTTTSWTENKTIATTDDIPTNVSELNNDAGYITGITSAMVVTALGYTPGTSNFSGDYNDLTNKPTLGTAASKDTGTSAGNVPVLDSNGKLVESIIPAVAITDTYEAASEAAMLALNAQKGDVCIRSDLNKSFILAQTPASTLANWKELKTPTDAVLSVNGQTGAVQLDASDVGALPDTTAYIKNASVSGNSLTLTKQDNTTVVYDPTFTDNDHYPTNFSWTNGTTSGPTGSLSGNSGFTTINFPAIPAASSTQSGIVTTGSQNFKGEKNFPNGIKSSVLKLYDSYNDDYSQVQSGDASLDFIPSGGDATFSMTDDGHFSMANSNGKIDINMKPTSTGNINVNMPSSSGTIALLEETQVEIVDLTQLN